MSYFPNLILAQSLLTALSSAFNSAYFLSYRSPYRRRQVGAAALAVVNLALFAESIYLGLLLLGWGWPLMGAVLLNPGQWLAIKSLPCLGSLLISALILRQLVSKAGH